MTQRQLDPPRPLPACPEGHRARHIFDCRRLEARGGHFIECACSRTSKHATFDLAWAHWHKHHGLQTMQAERHEQAAPPQLHLWLVGDTG